MKLSDFSLLDEEATDELHEFIQRLTQSDYPRHKTTHQLFMEQAGDTTAIAVLCGEKILTYEELDRQSTAWRTFWSARVRLRQLCRRDARPLAGGGCSAAWHSQSGRGLSADSADTAL